MRWFQHVLALCLLCPQANVYANQAIPIKAYDFEYLDQEQLPERVMSRLTILTVQGMPFRLEVMNPYGQTSSYNLIYPDVSRFLFSVSKRAVLAKSFPEDLSLLSLPDKDLNALLQSIALPPTLKLCSSDNRSLRFLIDMHRPQPNAEAVPRIRYLGTESSYMLQPKAWQLISQEREDPFGAPGSMSLYLYDGSIDKRQVKVDPRLLRDGVVLPDTQWPKESSLSLTRTRSMFIERSNLPAHFERGIPLEHAGQVKLNYRARFQEWLKAPAPAYAVVLAVSFMVSGILKISSPNRIATANHSQQVKPADAPPQTAVVTPVPSEATPLRPLPPPQTPQQVEHEGNIAEALLLDVMEAATSLADDDRSEVSAQYAGVGAFASEILPDIDLNHDLSAKTVAQLQELRRKLKALEKNIESSMHTPATADAARRLYKSFVYLDRIVPESEKCMRLFSVEPIAP